MPLRVKHFDNMSEREALSSRAIPFMELSDGSAASLTAPPPPLPHYLNAEGRAMARFAVEGNAVSKYYHRHQARHSNTISSPYLAERKYQKTLTYHHSNRRSRHSSSRSRSCTFGTRTGQPLPLRLTFHLAIFRPSHTVFTNRVSLLHHLHSPRRCHRCHPRLFRLFLRRCCHGFTRHLTVFRRYSRLYPRHRNDSRTMEKSHRHQHHRFFPLRPSRSQTNAKTKHRWHNSIHSQYQRKKSQFPSTAIRI